MGENGTDASAHLYFLKGGHMITNSGYTLYQTGNQIIICLPQTWDSLTNTVTPVSGRKKWLTDEEEAALLSIVKRMLEGSRQ